MDGSGSKSDNVITDNMALLNYMFIIFLRAMPYLDFEETHLWLKKVWGTKGYVILITSALHNIYHQG